MLYQSPIYALSGPYLCLFISQPRFQFYHLCVSSHCENFVATIIPTTRLVKLPWGLSIIVNRLFYFDSIICRARDID